MWSAKRRFRSSSRSRCGANCEKSDACRALAQTSLANTNVRETRREFDRAVKVPTARSNSRRVSRTLVLAKDVWAKARQASDFSQFAPHLERLLDLKRRFADHIGWTTEPYDALMDEYEP